MLWDLTKWSTAYIARPGPSLGKDPSCRLQSKMAPTPTCSKVDHIALFQPQSEEAFASLHSPSNKGFLDPSTATTQISIRFSQRPRDPTRGFVFGRIESLCDVLLTGSGISRRHFYIALNPRNGTPVLQDVSSYGTIVESQVRGTGTTHVRRQSVAIFDKDVIQAGLVKFVIAIPQYTKHTRETYMRNVLASCPVLDGLRIQPDLHFTMQEQGKLSLMTDLEETPSRLQKAVDHRGDFYALKLRSKSDKSCWDKNILHVSTCGSLRSPSLTSV